MKYYKDKQCEVYAYESDGSQDADIAAGLTAITEEEANTLRAPSTEQLAASARTKRDAALTACEWLVIRHRDQTDAGAGTTLTAAQYKELLTYRQALRDWPTTTGWPDVALPTPPAWLV